MAKTLTEQEILQLARLGALARLRELDEEAKAIRRMFPGLKGVAEETVEARKPGRPRKARKGGGGRMSPEARQAAAERMKAYWARKKGQAAAETAETAETAADAPRKPRGRKIRGRKRR